MPERVLRSNLCALLLALQLLFCLIVPVSASADAPGERLNVVVTIPVLKDFVEQVGGPHVSVTSLLKGYENEHTYSPKPSDLIAVRKARLLFQVGIGLEVWVSPLVKNAGGPSLHVVTTSMGIGLIGDAHVADDAHAGEEPTAGGNPHIWLDPANAVTMIRHITEALIQADPDHADDYRKNQAAYITRLDGLQTELSGKVKNLADRKFVAHHPAWPYLARRFRFDIVGTIQLQSGGEPSAHHIQELIQTMKRHKVRVVVSEIQLSQKFPDLLAKETGARVVILTTLPGGLPRTDTYLDMLRYNVLQLLNALEAA
ncbi:MAG TPA: metal ABC transporter substrate-binding protein [Nitrospira sp.]|nr:metal ABC transporter substrate-binding protein [Nitrospira sp.]